MRVATTFSPKLSMSSAKNRFPTFALAGELDTYVVAGPGILKFNGL
jgi:hypothetical protein